MANDSGKQTYMEKQKNLLAKLQEANYAPYEGDKDEALNHIGQMLTGFTDYVNVVIREQVMTPIWRQRCEPEELKDNIEAIDRQRRITHDACIANVNVLNRISGMVGLPPFADIDTSDRYAVADFIGDYVNEVFNGGIHGGMDAAVKDRHQDYDRKAVTDRVKDFEASMAARGLSIQEETHAQAGYEGPEV